ncbi:hypothetical protein [Spiroplasma chrysopicola]|uniref:Transmembrane protein n=1 Tax=Spiroplasma chrysopicola DF-1 TaxID=1276227 RepID=R4U0P6_9MOLU|nr:hypothetical protein [Spiroplasma chrysopicola]AGM24842.1 hypothetical protein SCHRY_v1c02570 [Spiroplasma chrysopicola DF-1]
MYFFGITTTNLNDVYLITGIITSIISTLAILFSSVYFSVKKHNFEKKTKVIEKLDLKFKEWEIQLKNNNDLKLNFYVEYRKYAATCIWIFEEIYKTYPNIYCFTCEKESTYKEFYDKIISKEEEYYNKDICKKLIKKNYKLPTSYLQILFFNKNLITTLNCPDCLFIDKIKWKI